MLLEDEVHPLELKPNSVVTSMPVAELSLDTDRFFLVAPTPPRGHYGVRHVRQQQNRKKEARGLY